MRLQLQPEADGLQNLDRRFERVLAQQGAVAGADFLVAHHLGAHLEAPQLSQKARHRTRPQGVQDFRFLVRSGTGVIRRLDRFGVDVALGRMAPGDEVLAAAVQVDGAVVALAVNLSAAHRADRRSGAAVVEGPRGADAAQVDPAMRLPAGGVPRVAVGALQEYAVAHQFVHRRLPAGNLVFGLVTAQRRLAGGARQVVLEEVGVGRVDHGVLDAAFEEVVGVFDEELVQGVPSGDEEDQRLAPAASDPSGALPGGDHRAGVADQDAHVQTADVDAQFQGRGGHHAKQLARVEGGFDVPPLLGQVAGAVRGDDVAQLGMPLRGRAVDELGHHPRPREDDRAQPVRHARTQQAGGEGLRAASRVDEHHVPCRGGGAVFGDGMKRPVRQRAGQVFGVADGGRAGHVGRLAAVGGAHPVQAPQQVQHVGAEHAAVGVQLVDHHVAQPCKERRPRLVEGQQPGVQHVRRGDEHVRRRSANLPAPVRRGVAVVDVNAEAAAQALQEDSQLVVLILLQGLEREDVERVRVGVLQQGGDDRHVVNQGLAAGRRRRHHDVVAIQGLADALGLMAV